MLVQTLYNNWPRKNDYEKNEPVILLSTEKRDI